ncbi:hypothetical protein WJX73_001412 [Symbiochloris irregularis]|uniref:DNA replication complex GINS protein SLD5 n=1 Tax=Symbiochloris irregularis TaxID=706552 RepID=A0AAW1PIX2_9CHLO
MESQSLGVPDLDTQADDAPQLQSDLARIKQAYVNEKVAPEILEYDEELVDRLRQRLADQEDKVQGLDAHWSVELERSMYQLELERLRYLLASYIRTRLKKVQLYAMLCLEEASPGEDGAAPTHPRLSRQEMQFVQEFFMDMGMHMKENILKNLPPGFDQLVRQSNADPTKDTMPAPDLDRHVFCRVLEDRGTVELDQQGLETANFEAGDLYVVRYKAVQDLLKDKWISLT